MTDEELRKEIVELFSLHPDIIINSGYGMPTPITILDIYKAGRSKTLQETEELKEDHAKQIEYLNSRIPLEGLQAMLSPREIVDFREYERRVEIRKKQQLKAHFEAGKIYDTLEEYEEAKPVTCPKCKSEMYGMQMFNSSTNIQVKNDCYMTCHKCNNREILSSLSREKAIKPKVKKTKKNSEAW